MSATAAWNRNVDDSLTWLNTTDGALGQALEIVQRARELAVQGGNGTLSTDARAAHRQRGPDLREPVRRDRQQQPRAGASSSAAPPPTRRRSTPRPQAATTPINTGPGEPRGRRQGSVMSVNITADRLQDPPAAPPRTSSPCSTDLATALQTNDMGAHLGHAGPARRPPGQHQRAARRGGGQDQPPGAHREPLRRPRRSPRATSSPSIEDVDMARGHHRPHDARVGLQRGPRHRAPGSSSRRWSISCDDPATRASSLPARVPMSVDVIPPTGGAPAPRRPGWSAARTPPR